MNFFGIKQKHRPQPLPDPIPESIAPVRDEMRRMSLLWEDMYRGRAPWLSGGYTHSLNLPASIASELARLATVSFRVTLTGSPRADYIASCMTPFFDRLREYAEYVCAVGGMAFRPEVCADRRINITPFRAGAFTPVSTSPHGIVTCADFTEEAPGHPGAAAYTRVERHSFLPSSCAISGEGAEADAAGSGEIIFRDDAAGNPSHSGDADGAANNPSHTGDADGAAGNPSHSGDAGGARYLIHNYVYRRTGSLLTPLPASLGEVEGWKDLPERQQIDGVDFPLFSYCRMPGANFIAQTSPLGVSVFARALDLIRDADLQYSRLLWEYEGGELAIDVSEDLFRHTRAGLALPAGKERLFRPNLAVPEAGEELMRTFSPALRDASYMNGLDLILSRIEDVCGLSRGTISSMRNIDRTATEVVESRQRMYATVRDVQKCLARTVRELVRAADALCTAYRLVPPGPVVLTVDPGPLALSAEA